MIIGVVVVCRDVTQERKLQEQLHHMQKLDAVGQLAGGIAHDFNNQLTGILGYAEMIAEKDCDESIIKFARKIISLTSVSSDLTKQLLAFSRKGSYRSVPVDLHAVISDVVSLLTHTIDKRINILCRLDAATHTLIGDPSQFHNALLNIALNARDAMPHGGQISFNTRCDVLDEDYCQNVAFELAPGRYLSINVSDTGCGMTPETIKHIFDPYFTTKELGKGTGMGLAAVYGTVQYYHGEINVYSEVDIGTTFSLRLPLAEKTENTLTEMDVPSAPNLRGLRVLVIDDEQAIRDCISSMVIDAGCGVIVAENGKIALTIYQSKWREIDIVIFDMIMPELDGKDTFRLMKNINPAIKSVLLSGYAVNYSVQALLAEGVKDFLQKPFSKTQLIVAIARAALDA